jgi:hypothetical protein
MAHFALLDKHNNVTQVVVVANDAICDDDGVESEEIGVRFCQDHVFDGRWVQTSYSRAFRHRYADPSRNVFYDETCDMFMLPQPYPSWTLDLNDEADWVAPIPMPTDDGYWYEWDEEGQTWVPHEMPEPEQP